jgi:hypothetical protein
MKCLDCEHAVMSVKDQKMCKCWKVEPAKRELKNAIIEHKCKLFKYLLMDQAKVRMGWKA